MTNVSSDSGSGARLSDGVPGADRSADGTVAGCLFCAIVRAEIPADIVYEGPYALAFRDISPKAPVHVLVIPRRHFADIGALAGQPETAAAVIDGIAATVRELGLTDYRTIFNTGVQAGQTVFHVHAHVLAGDGLRTGFVHG